MAKLVPAGGAPWKLVTPGRQPASAQRLARVDSPHAVRILQVFGAALMIAPSYYVIRPVGANAYLAGLVGMFAFFAWAIAVLFGVHDGRRNRHPVRGLLFVFWLVTLASYLMIDRAVMTTTQLQSADRFLMEMAVISGIALIAGECLRSLDDVKRVLRVLLIGASFCAFVAIAEFWAGISLTKYIHYFLPGFSLDGSVNIDALRGGLSRVAGTARDPIELGVVCGMLLPLAIYMALYDRDRKPWKRWAPVWFLVAALPTTVSRSAILAVVSSMTLLIVMMPAKQRLWVLACIPVALVGVFVSSHGLIGTLANFFGSGTSDPSVAHRLNNWQYVEQLVHQKPWLGFGGGTFIPSAQASDLHVLDDQYLHTAIELGLLGVLALALFLIVPLFAAIAARQETRDPEVRLLCAALAGSALAAAVCSVAFDSFSFPMFYGVYALVFGLIGTAVRLARNEKQQTSGRRRMAPDRPQDRAMRLTVKSAAHTSTGGA